jgi:hypothetical protein
VTSDNPRADSNKSTTLAAHPLERQGRSPASAQFFLTGQDILARISIVKTNLQNCTSVGATLGSHCKTNTNKRDSGHGGVMGVIEITGVMGMIVLTKGY